MQNYNQAHYWEDETLRRAREIANEVLCGRICVIAGGRALASYQDFYRQTALAACGEI